jgi:DNA-binding response OmpR family regulator
VDANLNGVSAEALVKKLTEQKIPTLLITGYSDKQRPTWAPDRFLTKPFNPDELLAAVAALGQESGNMSRS